jgi:hypothetical protein
VCCWGQPPSTPLFHFLCFIAYSRYIYLKKPRRLPADVAVRKGSGNLSLDGGKCAFPLSMTFKGIPQTQGCAQMLESE